MASTAARRTRGVSVPCAPVTCPANSILVGEYLVQTRVTFRCRVERPCRRARELHRSCPSRTGGNADALPRSASSLVFTGHPAPRLAWGWVRDLFPRHPCQESRAEQGRCCVWWGQASRPGAQGRPLAAVGGVSGALGRRVGGRCPPGPWPGSSVARQPGLGGRTAAGRACRAISLLRGVLTENT